MAQGSEAANLLLSAEGHLDEGETKDALQEAMKVKETSEGMKDLTVNAEAIRVIAIAHCREAQKKQAKPEDAEKIAQEGLARFSSLGRAKEEAVMLLCLSEINGEMRSSNRRTKAERWANQALAVFKKLDEKVFEAATLNQLSIIFRKEQDVEGAMQASEEAIAVAKSAGDTRMEALCLHGLAMTQALNMQYQDALKTEEEGLALVKKLGIKKMQAVALSQMARWHLLAGQQQLALTLAQKVVAIKAGSQETLVHVQALIENSKPHEALNAAKDGVERAKKLGDTSEEVGAFKTLAFAYLSQGDAQQAVKAYEDILAIARELKDHLQEFQTLHAIAVVYTGARMFEKAQTPLREAISISESPAETAMSLRALSEALIELGSYDEALETALHSQEAFQEDGDRSGEASALMLVASAYNLSGSPGKAIDMATMAQELVFIAGDSRREAIVLKMLAELQLSQGKANEAVDSLFKAVRASSEVGDVSAAARTTSMIGELYIDLNRIAEAGDMGNQALQMLATAKDPECEAFVQLLLWRVNLVQYDATKDGWFENQTKMASSQAIISAGKTSNILLQAAASYAHAQALCMGDRLPPPEALKLAKRAQVLYKEMGDTHGEVLLMGFVGVLTHALGEREKGKGLMEKALALARDNQDEPATGSIQQMFDSLERGGGAPTPARGRRGGGAPAPEAGGASVALGGGGALAVALDATFVRSKLMDLVSAAIGTGEDVEADSPLMDAGMDSLSATDFTSQVAKEFKMGATPSLVFDFPTVSEMVKHIVEESGGN